MQDTFKERIIRCTLATERDLVASRETALRLADSGIVDYAMPQLNGADFAQRLRERLGNAPILFVSGFVDERRVHEAAAGAPILRKPFSPSDLSAAVRRAIADP